MKVKCTVNSLLFTVYSLKHRNFKDSSLAHKFQMLLLAYFSKKYLNVSSCFYTLLGFRGASATNKEHCLARVLRW